MGKRKEIRKNSSLKGRTFLITRTKEGNAEESRILRAFGAKVVDFPTIKISPPASWGKLDRAISAVEKFDWIVFTSASGVKIFFDRLKKKRRDSLDQIRSSKSPRFACVGAGTQYLLESFGFKCSLVPKSYLTDELGRALAKTNISGKSILIPRAETANKSITKILKRAGAQVYELPIYRTVPATSNKRLNLDGISDVTLTSPSTVDGLMDFTTSSEIKSKGIRVHCIGPVTARRANSKGLKVSTVARNHTIDGLISDIGKSNGYCAWLNKR